MMLTACSGDEPGASRLPDGKHPLTLTATVGSPLSRAEGMESWSGGEKIAVNIGDYTGQYSMDANGKATASANPYYWQTTAKATVSAWYPYATEELTYNIADQSQGYADFDFLYAEAEGSYAAPVQLTFSHQMAKVSYNLVKGEGITAAELTAADVTLFGDKSVTVHCGKITGAATSQTDEITPCHDADTHAGSAVMTPQDMTGNPLIRVSINGNHFYYAPDTEAAGNLQAGYHYSYTITVKANGIEVTKAAGAQWADGGSEDVASKEVKQAFTSTDLKLGDYYYSDGTWSDGGLRTIYTDGTYRTDATVVPDPNKTVIGIVFHAGQHENDASDYSATGIGQAKCNGYAVALKDATSGYCMWGIKGTELGCCPTDADGNKQNQNKNPDIDWCGFAWTQKIIAAAGGRDKLNATEKAGYPATWYAVMSYETGCNAPSKSSGWFLPSIGQMWKIYQNCSFLFGSVSGAEGLKSDWYWSSSENNDNNPANYALFVDMFNGCVSHISKDSRISYVRPILAF